MLWVNHGLSPRDVMDAPPEVLAEAVAIINRRQRKASDEAAWARLREQLQSGP